MYGHGVANVLILGGKLEDHKDDFESCELVKVSTCKYCMPYENNVNIFVCHGFKASVKESWAQDKHYN